MSKVKRLIESYAQFIQLPWRDDAAAAQRVAFCVYPETEELRIRANLGEFELTTRQSGHDWIAFDLSDTFARWMAEQKYAEGYFRSPSKLPTVLHRYLEWLVDGFVANLDANEVDDNHVVMIYGVGSLFGLLKVKEVVDRLAPHVPGRLVVLFPGSFEQNNYRLLDGYDGWNYLATPILPDGAR
ncbi:BREX protein BrxB domain-containing protein [Arhodomonas aquaeolei]|uniref:BREX protein BrxB domain-containing protein n=1 Tax=Arhodomonas TaxID=2368 RepID=UPI000381C9BB|nr:BREX protein BrxB domain-containing protein [Arhodomonas aquaeolei]